VQRRLLARDLEKLTSATTTSKPALRKELDEIQRLGYAISDEDVIPGIGAVGRADLRPARSRDGVHLDRRTEVGRAG